VAQEYFRGMQKTNTTTATLLLSDGVIFKGTAFGVKGTAGGELCFNTGMTGYQEILTDPSYYGQIIIMNTAYIGNYGVSAQDSESDGAKVTGLICKNISDRFSRMPASGSLDNYLIENKIVAIANIDTRALVQHVRSKGAMNVVISSETDDEVQLKQVLHSLPDMSGLALAAKVTTREAYTAGNPDATRRVAVLDFGVKKSILENLKKGDLFMKVFPCHTSFEELAAFAPTGYFLSNGPGDPAAMTDEIATVKQILRTGKPVFGICLGHQLLALACGAATHKMHLGHRGLNHPVLNLETGKAEITSQNHGFGIDSTVLAQYPEIIVTHMNLNDNSIEGIRLKDRPIFSVQYHPEAGPGPHDAHYLFDKFFGYMG
jgi:carbamoyl-phosphate synthase small subunit